MIKKSLIFGLIAVLSAVFVFTGCNTGTSGTDSPVTVAPDGVVVDRTVSGNDVSGLVTALANSTVNVVAFIPSSDISTGNVIIPAGKTVYLLSSATDAPKAFGPAVLEVRGSLIVSESTILAASNTNRVYLGNTGSIQIQKGGELRTNARINVSDLTDAGTKETSAIGKVRYAGGSALTITGEPGLTTTDIGTLLGYLPDTGAALSVAGITGRTTALTLTAPLTGVKPSDFAGVGQINKNRLLTVTTQVPETAASLEIPAGLALSTAAGDLGSVTSLSVAGTLSTDTLPKLTALTVSAGGGLSASGAVGDATNGLGTVTIAGTVSVGTLAVASTAAVEVAKGGVFDGDAGAAAINAAEGATINGSVVKDAAAKIVVLTAATTTLPTTEAGTTYQIKGAVSFAATFTVVEGATLLIPKGASLTLASGGSIAGEGKVVVEEDGAAAGYPALDSTANYNPSGLKITYAEKNLKSGVLTVKLGGAVSGGIPSDQISGIWGPKRSNAPAGNWSAAVIVGILDTEALKAETVIKQTNQALRYYQGADDILTTEPDPANPPTTSGGTIYIDSSKAYKLKKYTSASGAVDGSNSGFGVLFWSGASPKTATIEITPATADSDYTVIVDWSGVTISQ